MAVMEKYTCIINMPKYETLNCVELIADLNYVSKILCFKGCMLVIHAYTERKRVCVRVFGYIACLQCTHREMKRREREGWVNIAFSHTCTKTEGRDRQVLRPFKDQIRV